jgi:hypothetical protein
VKLGRTVRFLPTDIEAFIERCPQGHGAGEPPSNILCVV